MEKQPYKIKYTINGKKTTILFVNRAFNPAFKQAMNFIERNKDKDIKLYYKNWNSEYNFGWKLIRI